MENYYYFWDRATGEDFFVIAEDEDEAMAIAQGYFEDPVFYYQVEEYEAEQSGLDIY